MLLWEQVDFKHPVRLVLLPMGEGTLPLRTPSTPSTRWRTSAFYHRWEFSLSPSSEPWVNSLPKDSLTAQWILLILWRVAYHCSMREQPGEMAGRASQLFPLNWQQLRPRYLFFRDRMVKEEGREKWESGNLSFHWVPHCPFVLWAPQLPHQSNS